MLLILVRFEFVSPMDSVLLIRACNEHHDTAQSQVHCKVRVSPDQFLRWSSETNQRALSGRSWYCSRLM